MGECKGSLGGKQPRKELTEIVLEARLRSVRDPLEIKFRARNTLKSRWSYVGGVLRIRYGVKQSQKKLIEVMLEVR